MSQGRSQKKKDQSLVAIGICAAVLFIILVISFFLQAGTLMRQRDCMSNSGAYIQTKDGCKYTERDEYERR
jgi:hypothetical protein